MADEGALAVVDHRRVATRPDGVQQPQDGLGLAGAGAADEGQMLALGGDRQRDPADLQRGCLPAATDLLRQLGIRQLDRTAQMLAEQHAPAEALDRTVRDHGERDRHAGGDHAAPQQGAPDRAGEVHEVRLGEDGGGRPFVPAARRPDRPFADIAADDLEQERGPDDAERDADLALAVQHDDAGEAQKQPKCERHEDEESEGGTHAPVAEQEHAEAATEIVAAMGRMGGWCGHDTTSSPPWPAPFGRLPPALPAAPLPSLGRGTWPVFAVSNRPG